MNKRDHSPKAPEDKDVVSMTGSSPPGDGEPVFEPMAAQAFDDIGYSILRRPVYRSTSERLAELCAEHARTVDFYNACTNAEDNADHGSDAEEVAKKATEHSMRMLAECEGMIEALPCCSIHDLGLKARVVSWDCAEWWDGDQDVPKKSARKLIDDVLAVAGIDRVRRSDFAFSHLLPGYTGAPRHLETPEVSPQSPKPVFPATGRAELEQLATEYKTAIELHRVYDKRSISEKGTLHHDKIEKAKGAEYDCISAVQARASFIRASSAREALFQLLLLDGDIDSLGDWVDPDGLGTLKTDVLTGRIKRYLSSIRGVLEELSGIRSEDVDSGYHMPRKYDPFETRDKDVALYEAEAVQPAADQKVAA